MKIPVLVSEIRAGKYDAVIVGMLPKDYVVLPKEMICELLLELNKRRKVMSRPRGKNE